MTDEPTSRWLAETGGTRGPDYAARFARLAEQGQAVHGEAEAVLALLGGPGRVLDAGCGIGRVAAHLAERGCTVRGVDSDASMVEQGRLAWPDLDLVVGDLLGADLGGPWDLAVLAGNVIVYVDPGTESAVVARVAGSLTPGGLLVSGWRTDRLAPGDYDTWATEAGLVPAGRWSTWDLDPWAEGSDWCVAAHRRTGDD